MEEEQQLMQEADSQSSQDNILIENQGIIELEEEDEAEFNDEGP